MGNLLIIAIGSALVNNVVLSQFLGLCPFLGVSKKIETAARNGRCRYLRIDVIILCNQFGLQVYISSNKYDLSADYRLYSGNCMSGSVCRDVFKESYTAPV